MRRHDLLNGRPSSGRHCPVAMLIWPCLLALGLLAMACAPLTSRLAQPTATPPFGLDPNKVVVDAWVDNPTPPLGSSITLSFNLLNQGVQVTGVVMAATWRQGGQLQTCHSQVTYDAGVCPIQVTNMEPGVYVPITVTVEFANWLFTGLTGFTPQ